MRAKHGLRQMIWWQHDIHCIYWSVYYMNSIAEFIDGWTLNSEATRSLIEKIASETMTMSSSSSLTSLTHKSKLGITSRNIRKGVVEPSFQAADVTISYCFIRINFTNFLSTYIASYFIVIHLRRYIKIFSFELSNFEKINANKKRCRSYIWKKLNILAKRRRRRQS
jgi:hypothetical protein